jgi:predicted RNA-binding protein
MVKEVFPLRLKLKRLNLSTQTIAFKPLIPKLSFIKNKKKWGGTLQGNALLKIPEQDYKLITSLL